jgi:putative DNA primase/helicase
MLPVKSNLGPDSSGYSYTVSVADNDAPHVRWGDERVTRTAEEVLSGAPSAREQAVLERGNDVCEWLRAALAAEPQPATSMWHQAEQRGYSRRDVERAKRKLGVTAEPLGYRGAWHWRLARVSP